MIRDRLAIDLPFYEELLAGHYVRGQGYGRRRQGGTDDWLLVGTLAGEGRFGEFPALPGSLTLLAPGVTHDYGIARQAASWEILWVHFHPPAGWLDLLRWPSVTVGMAQIRPAAWAEIATIFREVVRLSGSRPRMAMNALERLLLRCEESLPEKPSSLDERIRTVVEHIEANVGAPHSIQSLSERVHLSPSRFSHLFGEAVGLSPLQYVAQRRFARACILLERTTLSVAEVAAEVGMEPFHFSNWFKARSGVSPRAWRGRNEK